MAMETCVLQEWNFFGEKKFCTLVQITSRNVTCVFVSIAFLPSSYIIIIVQLSISGLPHYTFFFYMTYAFQWWGPQEGGSNGFAFITTHLLRLPIFPIAVQLGRLPSSLLRTITNDGSFRSRKWGHNSWRCILLYYTKWCRIRNQKSDMEIVS